MIERQATACIQSCLIAFLDVVARVAFRRLPLPPPSLGTCVAFSICLPVLDSRFVCVGRVATTLGGGSAAEGADEQDHRSLRQGRT